MERPTVCYGAETVVRKLCLERMQLLYGIHPPKVVCDRLERELELMGRNAPMYWLLYRVAKDLRDAGAISGTRGTVGSTLIAYLLGVSHGNPLPAHYRCRCTYAEFVPAVSGYDLPEKICPKCGKAMTGDGHDIPFESCMGLDGSRELVPNITVPETMVEHAMDRLRDEMAEDRVDVVSQRRLDRLQKLYAITGARPEEVDYTDPAVYEMIRDWDCCGVPELLSDFYEQIVEKADIRCFSDLSKMVSMAHGTVVWKDNGEALIREVPFRALIGNRDDVMLALMAHGVERETAYLVTERVRRGRFGHFARENPRLCQELEGMGVPRWYLASMEKIHYLTTRAYAVQLSQQAYQFVWFKLYYPEAFYKVMLDGAEVYRGCTTQELAQMYNARSKAGADGEELDLIELLIEAKERVFWERD